MVRLSGQSEQSTSLDVFYDGSCPICKREIAAYRRMRSSSDINWVDASQPAFDEQRHGLSREAALSRLHVKTADGRMSTGVSAFQVLWSRLPFAALATLAERRWFRPFLEVGYRAFLALRGRDVVKAANFRSLPRWLQRELRSDHAGELGAVHFYRAVLFFTRARKIRYFSKRHLVTERRHLRLMNALVPVRYRSRLCYLWISAAWALGIVASAAGQSGIYATVAGIERFVEQHYGAQLDALDGEPSHFELRQILASCLADEIEHREQAQSAYAGTSSKLVNVWHAIISAGSNGAVYLARFI